MQPIRPYLTPTRSASASFSGHYLGTRSRNVSSITDGYSDRPCDMMEAQIIIKVLVWYQSKAKNATRTTSQRRSRASSSCAWTASRTTGRSEIPKTAETHVEERPKRLWVRVGEIMKRLRWTSVGRWWLAWVSGARRWVLARVAQGHQHHDCHVSTQ